MVIKFEDTLEQSRRESLDCIIEEVRWPATKVALKQGTCLVPKQVLDECEHDLQVWLDNGKLLPYSEERIWSPKRPNLTGDCGTEE